MSDTTIYYVYAYLREDGTPYYRIIYLKDETKPHVANLEMDWQRIQLLALENKKEKQMVTWSEKKKKETFISIKSDYIKCDYFNDWILDLLNYRGGEDTLDDLFPGTNGMAEAIDRVKNRLL
jgi:hypothetical protein